MCGDHRSCPPPFQSVKVPLRYLCPNRKTSKLYGSLDLRGLLHLIEKYWEQAVQVFFELECFYDAVQVTVSLVFAYCYAATKLQSEDLHRDCKKYVNVAQGFAQKLSMKEMQRMYEERLESYALIKPALGDVPPFSCWTAADTWCIA